MLGFIIPLKSRQTSRDWQYVGRLLERTLRSACAQTHPGFHIVVACHDIPNLSFSHPQIEWCPVDFDPPGPERAARRQDKLRKYNAGLRRIGPIAPTHIMVLDADDLVSNRLAAYVAAHSRANGWYFRSGYFYAPGMPSVHVERRRFHQWCASSHILSLENIEREVGSAPGWHLRHRFVVAQQRARGTPLRPLPFRGAIYTVSHGENFNDYAPILWPANPVKRLVRRVLYHRQLTSEIRDEFGLYPVEAAHPAAGSPRPSR